MANLSMYIGKDINRELEHKELTEKIIGAVIQVHKQLGPGFIEFHYLIILAEEQQEVIAECGNMEVGREHFDFFVEGVGV